MTLRWSHSHYFNAVTLLKCGSWLNTLLKNVNTWCRESWCVIKTAETNQIQNWLQRVWDVSGRQVCFLKHKCYCCSTFTREVLWDKRKKRKKKKRAKSPSDWGFPLLLMWSTLAADTSSVMFVSVCCLFDCKSPWGHQRCWCMDRSVRQM